MCRADHLLQDNQLNGSSLWKTDSPSLSSPSFLVAILLVVGPFPPFLLAGLSESVSSRSSDSVKKKKKDEGDQGRHPDQPVEATYTYVHLNLDGHSHTGTQSIISVAHVTNCVHLAKMRE